MPNRNPRSVVIAAGGTGGHLFPALALAEALTALELEPNLVTDRRAVALGSIPEGLAVHPITSGAMVGRGLAAKARSAVKVLQGVVEARGLLGRLGAACVVGFGGYPSVPPVLAARSRGLPIVIHEQNAVLGKANRFLAPRADVIATAFEPLAGIEPTLADRVRLVGNPVRKAIAALGGIPYKAPDGDGPISLLVFGGSQGAKSLTDAVPAAVAALPEALRRRLKVVQQAAGEGAEQSLTAAYGKLGIAAEVARFFDDMPERLAAAQLVISRSGASTLAELQAAGRPALLVPYPHNPDRQQYANAEAQEAAGAGWKIEEPELAEGRLAGALRDLLEQPARLAEAAAKARALAKPDAAKQLANLVAGLITVAHRQREQAA